MDCAQPAAAFGDAACCETIVGGGAALRRLQIRGLGITYSASTPPADEADTCLRGPQLKPEGMIVRTNFVLAVPDVERSARYYRDVLGFEVRDMEMKGGERWCGMPATS